MTQWGAMGGPPVKPDGMSPSGARSPSSRPADLDIYWILRGHEAVRANHQEWMDWMLSEPQTIAGFNRLKRVGRRVKVGPAEVSTVFLSIDHNWGGGKPILFETMIFGGDHDGWQDRYHTYDEAMAGHKRVIAALRDGREP